MTSPECLSEDDVIAFVHGQLSGEALTAAERHLSNCEECPRLVAETAREVSQSASQPGTDTREDDAPPPPLEPGALVGRYVIERAVGEGAMGRVYAARDPELDRIIALKVLHPRVATAELEARLQREAKAMARVSEPEVIAVYDAGRHGAQVFIAMELVQGGTLRQWVGEKPRPWREVLAVFLRAARGLAQAHAAGLVHRDFKPDNVLIGRDGRVRVTDFGLARTPLSSDPETPPAHDAGTTSASIDVPLTRTGAVVGTPAYMTPEQMRGAPADGRSDLYAWCVSVYEALYGERPFPGKTFSALLQAKSEGRVRPPPPGSHVPARLRRALLVGLSARQEDRYASVPALLESLEGASRASRAPRIAAGVVVVAGLLAVALGVRGRVRSSPSAIAPPGSALVATAPRCSAAACTASHAGVPHACRPSDGACVTVASEDCTPTFEPVDLLTDDTLWLGTMLPMSGPAAESYGRMNAEGIDFARREIAEATRALESASASKHVRRIALVTCDDVVDPARAARHLALDLGVPAIVGFGSGQKLIDLAGPILIPNRVLSIASLSSNPLVTRVPQPSDQPRMIWRTTYNWHDVAGATARFLHDVLEPRAGIGGSTRITVARIDMPAGLWFSEELYRRLVFNGKSAVDNGAAYQEVTVPANPPELAVLRSLADSIVLARPTFVVLSGATAVTSPLIQEVEARWQGGTARPTYVVSDNSTESLAAFMSADVGRRRRIFAVSSLSNETPTARFVIRYNASHATPITRYLNPGTGYDAFYMLAYAAFALGAQPIDGPALARTFARLVAPGREIEVGPMALFDGIAALARGETLDLRGASGGLDFDLATGEATFDFALVCADVDAHGRASGDVESGVYYRAATHQVEGSMRCP